MRYVKRNRYEALNSAILHCHSWNATGGHMLTFCVIIRKLHHNFFSHSNCHHLIVINMHDHVLSKSRTSSF